MSSLEEVVEEIYNKLMKIAESGAVFAERTVKRQVRFSNNKIDVAKEWDETSINILAEKDKKSVVLNLTYPAKLRIDEIIEKAKKALELAPPKPYYAPFPKPAEKYPEIGNVFDKYTHEHPEDMIDMAKTAIDEALKDGAKKVAGAIYSTSHWTALRTSGGYMGHLEYTNAYIDVRAFCGNIETGHYSQAGRGIKDLDAKKAGSEAARFAVLSKNPKKLSAGEYKTLLVPDAVASIINFVGMFLSGFAAMAGYSAYINKLGQKVASDSFTLEDTPLRKDAYNPYPNDLEGVPTRNLVLIDRGILKTYVHNRTTAAIFKTESTGHAGWIFPMPWNLAIKEGDMQFDEMISSMDEGIIVGNVTYIRFQDYMKGDFSGIIRDGVIYVKNGEPQHGVKGLRLSDNVISLLSNVVGVGSQQRQLFHWWLEVGIPVYSVPLLIEKARFSEAW